MKTYSALVMFEVRAEDRGKAWEIAQEVGDKIDAVVDSVHEEDQECLRWKMNIRFGILEEFADAQRIAIQIIGVINLLMFVFVRNVGELNRYEIY